MNVIAKLFCVVYMMLCAACESGTTDEKGDDITGVPGKNYATPTDKTIGNGYTIHKFVGEYDEIARDTAVQDVNYYLNKAESYVKGLGNKFSNKTYFSSIINSLQNTTNYNVDGYDGARKMDAIINAFKPCETIFQEIIRNLGDYNNADKNILEREAFEMCYRVLANEAYYEGYGADRNMVKNEYEKEKNELSAGWFGNEFLYPNSNLVNAYNQNNFSLITYQLNNLLNKAAKKMNVTSMDLREVVNIALAGESLHAMHDLTDNLLDHKQETMVYNPTLKIQREMNTLYSTERAKYEGMSMGL